MLCYVMLQQYLWLYRGQEGMIKQQKFVITLIKLLNVVFWFLPSLSQGQRSPSGPLPLHPGHGWQQSGRPETLDHNKPSTHDFKTDNQEANITRVLIKQNLKCCGSKYALFGVKDR